MRRVNPVGHRCEKCGLLLRILRSSELTVRLGQLEMRTDERRLHSDRTLKRINRPFKLCQFHMGSSQSVIDRPSRVLMSEGVGVIIAGFAPVSQACPRLGEIEGSFSIASILLQGDFQTGSGARVVSQLEISLADL